MARTLDRQGVYPQRSGTKQFLNTTAHDATFLTTATLAAAGMEKVVILVMNSPV
jgi:hypothetical protein